VGLASASGPNYLITGGTDLMLDLKQGHHPPVNTLVDVTTIPEMNALEIREEGLFIGAVIPFSHLVASDIIREHARALFKAADLMG
jgi:CO/xanthine dehydrogenase FAD-binding subunit